MTTEKKTYQSWPFKLDNGLEGEYQCEGGFIHRVYIEGIEMGFLMTSNGTQSFPYHDIQPGEIVPGPEEYNGQDGVEMVRRAANDLIMNVEQEMDALHKLRMKYIANSNRIGTKLAEIKFNKDKGETR